MEFGYCNAGDYVGIALRVIYQLYSTQIALLHQYIKPAGSPKIKTCKKPLNVSAALVRPFPISPKPAGRAPRNSIFWIGNDLT